MAKDVIRRESTYLGVNEHGEHEFMSSCLPASMPSESIAVCPPGYALPMIFVPRGMRS